MLQEKGSLTNCRILLISYTVYKRLEDLLSTLTFREWESNLNSSLSRVKKTYICVKHFLERHIFNMVKNHVRRNTRAEAEIDLFC